MNYLHTVALFPHFYCSTTCLDYLLPILFSPLLVVVAHQFTLIHVLSPLWQIVRNVHSPPLVKDMTLRLKRFRQTLDPSSSGVFGRVILFSLLPVCLAVGMVLIVLLVGFFLGSWEIKGGRETDHHVSTLVKHRGSASSTRNLVR